MKSYKPIIILLCLICALAFFHFGCALITTKCPSCSGPVSAGDAHYTFCSEGHGIYSCDHAAVDAHQH